MKTKYILVLISLWAFAAMPARAVPPELINYQGRLVDTNGLVTRDVALQIRFFDAAASGTLLYEDSNTVTVVDGLYSTLIGDNTTYGSLTNALTNASVYVEVVLDGQTLAPRDRLVSVAYALNGAAGPQGPAGTNGVNGIDIGLVNGLSVRDPILTLAVDGTGPYATITTSPSGQIEYWFGKQIVQYGTSAVVRLTAGTPTTPALNYICALSDGTLTNYTSYPYRTESGLPPRAIMFEVFLMDNASVSAGTGYAIRSWTENAEDRKGLGRVSWIGERVRRLPALWESGVQVSLSATNATSDAYILTSAGLGWQMHSHTIPANSSMTPMWVLNDPAGFQAITNLQQITKDSSGTAILAGNNDCFAINVYAFVESGITPKSTRLMLTLSTDDYASGNTAQKLANCIADASSLDVVGVPVWMQGMTIRLARIVIRRDSDTTRTYWIYDRRGQPLGTAGGGASSSGESDPIWGAEKENYTAINDGSKLYSVWTAGGTNSLYIVSPDGLYTNLLKTTP